MIYLTRSKCDFAKMTATYSVLDQDCGLWGVGSLLFNGCAKLLDNFRKTMEKTQKVRTQLVCNDMEQKIQPEKHERVTFLMKHLCEVCHVITI